MNRREHLLTIAAEECAEIAHRCSKAKRFGHAETEPGQDFTNAERIVLETIDLFAVLEMLRDEGVLPNDMPGHDPEILKEKKKSKVEKYLEYSRTMGTLTDA